MFRSNEQHMAGVRTVGAERYILGIGVTSATLLAFRSALLFAASMASAAAFFTFLSSSWSSI